MAGKSTLNRLELSRETPTKYRKIAHEPAAIEALFVDLLLEAHHRHYRSVRVPRRSATFSRKKIASRVIATKR